MKPLKMKFNVSFIESIVMNLEKDLPLHPSISLFLHELFTCLHNSNITCKNQCKRYNRTYLNKFNA